MVNSSTTNTQTPPEVSAPMPENPATDVTQPVGTPVVLPQPMQAPMGVASEIPVTPPAAPNIPPPPAIGEPLPPEVKPKKKFPLKILAVVIVALLLLSATSTVMYAYNVIPGDAKVQDSIAKVLMKLPFMPKTPRAVLELTTQANRNITSVAVDMTTTMVDPQARSLLGSDIFVMHVTGVNAMTDTKNPAYSYHLSLSQVLEADLLTKDHKSYIKVDKVPESLDPLLAIFGITDQTKSQFLNQWFVYDLTPFTSLFENEMTPQNTSGVESGKILDPLTDPTSKNALTVNSELLSGISVYHFHFAPDSKQLDAFWSAYTKGQKTNTLTEGKLSDTLKNMVLDFYIDQKTYLLNKLTIQFTPVSSPTKNQLTTISPTAMLSSDTPITISILYRNFNQPITIEAPQNAKDLGQFFQQLSMQSATQSGSLINDSFIQDFDVKRRSDVNQILNAIKQYAADHKGALPPGITTTDQEFSPYGVNLCPALVPTYLPSLPIDPVMSPPTQSAGEPVKTCPTFYHTGYYVKKSHSNKVTVSAPQSMTPISVTR